MEQAPSPAARPTCVGCKTEMQMGFLPEATVGGFFVTQWQKGDADFEHHSWLERLASPGGVRYSREDLLSVDAWRCPSCGRLDLYALRPPPRGTSL